MSLITESTPAAPKFSGTTITIFDNNSGGVLSNLIDSWFCQPRQLNLSPCLPLPGIQIPIPPPVLPPIDLTDSWFCQPRQLNLSPCMPLPGGYVPPYVPPHVPPGGGNSVPAPGTVLLLGTALILFGVLMYLRRKRGA